MNFRRASRSRAAEAAIDLMSLIDVVFLLVIFLLVSTTFKKKQLAIELDMPRAGTAEFRITGREHILRIGEDGSFFLCPDQVTKDEGDALKCGAAADQKALVARFRALAQRYPNMRVGVYAASKVPWENAVRVMTAAQEAGVDFNIHYQTDGTSAGDGGDVGAPAPDKGAPAPDESAPVPPPSGGGADGPPPPAPPAP